MTGPVPSTKDLSSESYEPPRQAIEAADVVVDPVWEANGSPSTITLDKYQLTRIVAWAVDLAVKASGRKWA